MREVIRLSWAELKARLEGGGAPTDDEVSITNDGRRLDSKEAVLKFLAEWKPNARPGTVPDSPEQAPDLPRITEVLNRHGVG